LGLLRRPPTPCAHRLRKPDRTLELLALSVARWARGCGLHDPALPSAASRSRRLPHGALQPETSTAPDPPVAAVGLERQPPDRPERLPSDRLEPCGPSRLHHARCSLARLRPAPGRPLRAWACPVKGWLVASGYLALARAASSADRVKRRERCVSPTSATDSRHEHPTEGPIPGRTPRRAPRLAAGIAERSTDSPWAGARRRRGLGACRSACQMSRPSGASLDGEPPASAPPQPTREPRRVARRLVRARRLERSRAWRSAVLAEP